MFLNRTPPLCFIKPGLRLICSNFSDIIFYNIKVKINKIIKIIIKKYITDFCKDAFKNQLNISKSKHRMIVKNNKIVTLSLAIDSITIIKLVLKPVDPTAPTIIPAVAIAIPTATIFRAPFSKPTIV